MKNLKNKILVLFFFSLFLLCSVYTISNAENKYPSPTNLKYINDYSSVISDNYKKQIISIGKELEDKTTAQAVIVVINSTNGTPIEDYSNKLFRLWGIGQKDKDNGLLILVAIEDRQFRVEVGRGLEGAITDALSNRIMQTLAKPYFLDGNYSKGLLDSYSTFCDYIAEEYDVTLDKSLNIAIPSSNETNKNTNINLKYFTLGTVLLVLLDLLLNRGRVVSTLLQLFFWSNFFRGGRRGGGGGSGSGGGFGGGSSNGGGSSGNW